MHVIWKFQEYILFQEISEFYFVGVGVLWVDLNRTDVGFWRLTITGNQVTNFAPC